MKPRHLLVLAAAALLPLAMVSPSSAAAGSVTLPAVEDVFVSSASPTSAGNHAYLRTDPQRFAYLKFNVTGVPADATGVTATLRLTGIPTLAWTTGKINVHRVGNAWSEATTYRTRPSLGTRVAAGVAVANGQSVEITVPVRGNGTFSFALAKPTAGSAYFASSEHTDPALHPSLRVNYTTPDAPPPPDPDPTDPPDPVVGLPYGADSFYQSDTAGLPVNAGLTSTFRSFMQTAQGATTWPKVNLNPGWSGHNHVHRAGQSTPVWKLTGTSSGTSNTRLNIARTQGVHMPDNLWATVPTGDQDRLLVVQDFEFGYTIQCADVVPNHSTRTWTASNCGIMWHSSNGLDYRNPRSDDQRNFTSRGRILDAMQVPRSELDQAVAENRGLGRVMHVFFVETDTAAGFVHPMVGTESSKNGWGAEGVRIGIDPSIDLVARGLTGHALAIARTLQDNGGYIGDNSGSNTQLKIGPPEAYQGTNLSTDVFKGKIHWNDFVVYEPGSQ